MSEVKVDVYVCFFCIRMCSCSSTIVFLFFFFVPAPLLKRLYLFCSNCFYTIGTNQLTILAWVCSVLPICFFQFTNTTLS